MIGLLVSCAAPEVHIHDRHALSYPLVRDFAKSHPGTTLVLFDYHHDIAPADGGVSSSNWVGALLAPGLVDRVVWVSGRTLQLPNRNSRMKWLNRSLEGFAPSDSARIAERVVLMDWNDLRTLRTHGPVVVSFDLDLLCHDPGDPPQRFLDELVEWISTHRPRLVTVALSAAYQPDASLAWDRLERLITTFPEPGAAWYLEAGLESANPEGPEENGAWRLWQDRPASFQGYAAGFWPGTGMWIEAPQTLRDALTRRGVRPGDAAARDVLSGWSDGDRKALEATFSEGTLQGLAAAAAESLEGAWVGHRLPEPPAGASGRGVAVRLLNKGLDRGCLSLYGGVINVEAATRYCAQEAASDPRYPPVQSIEKSDLDVEIALFGPWRTMKDPMDFRPGLDSLLLHEAGQTTLLQASLAVQRRYDRTTFLRVLSKKAGLGFDGWKEAGVTLKRASTIWYRQRLAALETAPSCTTPGPRTW